MGGRGVSAILTLENRPVDGQVRSRGLETLTVALASAIGRRYGSAGK